MRCNTSEEEIKVKGFYGKLKCPENLQSICLSKRFCKNKCSGNGMCIKGECHCLQNYRGDDCSI